MCIFWHISSTSQDTTQQAMREIPLQGHPLTEKQLHSHVSLSPLADAGMWGHIDQRVGHSDKEEQQETDK
jgi:hypothetical protein